MGHHHGSSKDWPPVCAAAELSDISAFGYCLNGTFLETIHNSSIGECCSACANKSEACGGWNMPNGDHGVCNLIAESDHDWHPVGPKDPCVSAYKFSGGVGHISDGVRHTPRLCVTVSRAFLLLTVDDRFLRDFFFLLHFDCCILHYVSVVR